MFPHKISRNGITPFDSPIDDNLDFSLDVDMSLEENAFEKEILATVAKTPEGSYVQLKDITDLKQAFILLRKRESSFKIGDYIIICNEDKTEYKVYIRTVDDWIVLGGESFYNAAVDDSPEEPDEPIIEPDPEEPDEPEVPDTPDPVEPEEPEPTDPDDTDDNEAGNP